MPAIHVMPQLAFSGQWRQAFEDYAKVLGGKITSMNSFGDSDTELPPASTAASNLIDPPDMSFAPLTICRFRFLVL